MPNTRTLRWGIIGPGRIAHKFAHDLHLVQGSTVQAVGSRDGNRAREFAERYGAVSAYASYEEVAADPEVDVVYIATPHRYHHENARACLEAGKAVLCEKPLTVTAAETRELIELARNRGLFLMEALWTRCLPVYAQVRSWLDAGAVGEVYLISATIGFKAARDPLGRMFNNALAGGALLDLGVYPIAVSQWITGTNPVSWHADGHLGETNVDEKVSVQMRYASGCFSQFTASAVSQLDNSLTISGTGGRIRIEAPFWGATRASLVQGGQETVRQLPFRGEGFEYQIEEAASCLRTRLPESPAMPLSDSLANMELMDSLRAAIGLKYAFE